MRRIEKVGRAVDECGDAWKIQRGPRSSFSVLGVDEETVVALAVWHDGSVPDVAGAASAVRVTAARPGDG